MSKTIKDMTHNEFKSFCDAQKETFNGCTYCSLNKYCEYIDFNFEFFNSDKKAFSDELLNTQVKTRPSKDAITILKHIHSRYKWIAKDCYNWVWVFDDKPKVDRYNKEDSPSFHYFCMILDEEVFDFLSCDEEPVNIGELLGEYEDD